MKNEKFKKPLCNLAWSRGPIGNSSELRQRQCGPVYHSHTPSVTSTRTSYSFLPSLVSRISIISIINAIKRKEAKERMKNTKKEEENKRRRRGRDTVVWWEKEKRERTWWLDPSTALPQRFPLSSVLTSTCKLALPYLLILSPKIKLFNQRDVLLKALILLDP